MERTILTPTNEIARNINKKNLDLIPGTEQKAYISIDTMVSEKMKRIKIVVFYKKQKTTYNIHQNFYINLYYQEW